MANKPGIDIYRRMLHAPVYGLWTGVMNISNFIESFSDAVFTGLRAAWLAGAEQAGVKPDELTNREIQQMQTDIFVQLTYVPGFGTFIMQHSRANKGKLSTALARMELWVTRYNEFYTRGYAMAKLDQKLKWALGATDKHCGSCVKLNGKVKRASQWLDANIYPKSPELECHGYHCQCTLDPTDEPMSKGRLPRLP